MANSQNAQDVSVLDKASSMTVDQAVALAKSHLEGFAKSGASPDEPRVMGLTARANADYRKVIESVPQLAKLTKDAITIAAQMPRAEWAQAKDLAGENGRVYLPKILTDYAGKIVMVTDTHIVQQASKNSVIAHDLSKLDNRDDLVKLNAEGKLQGKYLKVEYGSHEGKTQVMTFAQMRDAEVLKKAVNYADTAFKTPQTKANFLKHVEKMMLDVERSNKAPVTPAQQPARHQQRDQERTR